MQRDFKRQLGSLAALYEQTEAVLEAHDVAAGVRFPVHLAMEELFVNMVKYNPEVSTDIGVSVDIGATGLVTVTLIDDGGIEFDVTASRNVDVAAPLDERTPGGLGLHLIQNLTDTLNYEYQDGRGKVIFTKGSGNNDV
jgi:anti-sigma regulatory factor (Ser/Thr protein kinase)